MFPDEFDISRVTIIFARTKHRFCRALTIDKHVYVIIDTEEYDFVCATLVSLFTSPNLVSFLLGIMETWRSELDIAVGQDCADQVLHSAVEVVITQLSPLDFTRFLLMHEDLKAVLDWGSLEPLRRFVLAFLVGHELGHYLYKHPISRQKHLKSHIDRIGADVVDFVDRLDGEEKVMQDSGNQLIADLFFSGFVNQETNSVSDNLLQIANRYRKQPQSFTEELFSDYWGMRSVIACSKLHKLNPIKSHIYAVLVCRFVSIAATFRFALLTVESTPDKFSRAMAQYAAFTDRHDYFNGKLIPFINGSAFAELFFGTTDREPYLNKEKQHQHLLLMAELQKQYDREIVELPMAALNVIADAIMQILLEGQCSE